ncbi:hypothetical protein [Pseudoramibacter alactolyticus]
MRHKNVPDVKIEEIGIYINFDKQTSVAGLDYSPIRGPRGNIEFLCLTRKEAPAAEVAHDEAVSGAAAIEALVTRAHRHYQNGESEETK